MCELTNLYTAQNGREFQTTTDKMRACVSVCQLYDVYMRVTKHQMLLGCYDKSSILYDFLKSLFCGQSKA